MPQLDQDVFQPYASSGEVAAFAISSSIIGTENPDDLRQYVEGLGLTMTVLVDYDATLYDDYDFTDPDAFAPYPREIIIGRDGRVAYLRGTLDVESMKAVIEAELAK
ncbi:MAG: TlpA family protein disulfide reductase [Myxococcota bacterium]